MVGGRDGYHCLQFLLELIISLQFLLQLLVGVPIVPRLLWGGGRPIGQLGDGWDGAALEGQFLVSLLDAIAIFLLVFVPALEQSTLQYHDDGYAGIYNSYRTAAGALNL